MGLAAIVVLCAVPFLFDLPAEIVVFVIGASVGATELLTRYRDAPFRPLLTPWGLVYALLNGGAAVLAYRLLGTFGVTFGQAGTPASQVYRVAVASLGAMAFFRTGLFTVRIGDTDIPVGPNLVLQALLQALDRSYDRHRAAPRSVHVNRIMAEVSFDRAAEALPSLCLGLMQNVSDAEQAEVGREIADLRAASMSDEAKRRVLGLTLMNLVGEKVLERAVIALGPTIKGPPPLDVDLLSRLARTSSDLVVANLPAACQIVCRGDVGESGISREVERVRALPVGEDAQAVFMVQILAGHYGEGIVGAALTGLGTGAPGPAAGAVSAAAEPHADETAAAAHAPAGEEAAPGDDAATTADSTRPGTPS